MAKRIVLCLFLVFALSANAMAAGVPVIVQLGPLGNILNVVNVLGGTLLDSVPEKNTYLLNLPNLPLISPLVQLLLGITGLEVDRSIPVPKRSQMGILTVGAATDSDWYKNQPELQRIHAVDAQKHSTGRGIVVADLNSSVDYGHPALIGHLTSGFDFVNSRSGYQASLNQSSATFLDQASATYLDQSSATFLDQASATFLDQSSATFIDQASATFLDSGNPAYAHGTLCAGIIAAVAPDSIIMPLRVFDDSGQTDVFSVVKAIHYAVRNGARVINMSFGMSQSYASIQAAINQAANAGVVVVASAGNANTAAPQFPASVSSVISVAAVNSVDKKASFSNYGGNVYVDAPGVNIISAYPGGHYGIVSGTSFSAPMVAAEAAMIMSVKNANVKSTIGAAVVDIYPQNPSYQGKLGKGRIDILSAVR